MLKLTNNFHLTEVRLKIGMNVITNHQIKRARKILCGIKNCTCGGELGERPMERAILGGKPVYFFINSIHSRHGRTEIYEIHFQEA